MIKVHHIGYLVKKIRGGVEAFKKLGFFVKKDIVFDDYRKINVCFLEKDGYVVELVSPTSEDSIVSNLMKRYRNCPYHLCYITDNYEFDIQELLKQHYVFCSEKHEACAIDGKNVCFMINPNIGMIEIIEDK